MVDLIELSRAIETGDRTTAVGLTRAALDGGFDPRSILSAMTGAMDVIGRRFQESEIYVPEMLISARAMKEALAVLQPALVAEGVKPEYRAVVGTIEGDLHDIGKNLVAMMWKGAGFDVLDLGVNVPAARFVDAAREQDAHILGLSALLTTTMPAMTGVVRAVREAGLTTKVVIGGAPTTPEFAAGIGADGHAPDAAAAVDLARRLLAH